MRKEEFERVGVLFRFEYEDEFCFRFKVEVVVCEGIVLEVGSGGGRWFGGCVLFEGFYELF